jgi:hypothetical protein
MKRFYKAVEFEIGKDTDGFYVLIEGQMRLDRYRSEAAAIVAVEAWVDSLEKLWGFGIV